MTKKRPIKRKNKKMTKALRRALVVKPLNFEEEEEEENEEEENTELENRKSGIRKPGNWETGDEEKGDKELGIGKPEKANIKDTANPENKNNTESIKNRINMINITYNSNNKGNNNNNTVNSLNNNSRNNKNIDNNGNYHNKDFKAKNPSKNPAMGKNPDENPPKNPAGLKRLEKALEKTPKKTLEKTQNKSQNNYRASTHADPQAKTRKKRKIQKRSLLKLYERDAITLKQYSAGERLIRDYENSFKNRSSPFLRIRKKSRTKTNRIKQNQETSLIQNINFWERYTKAISSIEDIQTREIIKQFCIDNINLTELDKKLKKRGVAELRLIYGLDDLAKYYIGLKKEE
jgi:hypothetical protein